MDTGAVDPDGVVLLVAEIVRGAPNLPGAACRGRFELFDEAVGRGGPERPAQERQRLQRAAELCRGCPARPACPCPERAKPSPTCANLGAVRLRMAV
ncbi:MAG: hypothetical protein ACRDS1_04060 [Pseudonocardiaceae bacterium]